MHFEKGPDLRNEKHTKQQVTFASCQGESRTTASEVARKMGSLDKYSNHERKSSLKWKSLCYVNSGLESLSKYWSIVFGVRGIQEF